MAEKELIKCPKCGGSSGFYHKYIQSHTQFIGFYGKPSAFGLLQHGNC